MTSHERWREIDDRFREALDLPEDRRSAFLDDLSTEDEELRRSVEALLRAAEDSAPFLQSSVDESCAPPWSEIFEIGSTGDDPERDDRSGERVGPYRLVRRIGRGGMATVYLAERADGLWEQKVALKLIRRGLDTADVVRRFLAERQILSSLRHPNIASLLDGGTTPGGLPYLVMEYVEGTPITEYCDRCRLTVEERLRLFCEVGRAVQDAHRSLIVHRDLKPSNILVTEERRVKLLDFGIAKLLDAESDFEVSDVTRPGHRPLTPEYASPEQLTGGPITTASDIYQLGVLLYRLLYGRRPDVRARNWPLVSRPDTHGSLPDPPSRALGRELPDAATDGGGALASRRGTTPDRLERRLRGDLATIVAKAMRAEPGERYDSVGALVEDVERHLEQLPIRARAPTRRYRLRKFLTRNAWVGPVTAAALLGVGLYAFSMDRQARALEQQRNAARDEAARAEAIQGFMTDLFRSPDPFAPADPERGRRITVVEALEIGTERVRAELAGRPALQADLFTAIADVYGSLDLDDRERRLRHEALERAMGAYGERSPETASFLHALGSSLGVDGESRDSAETVLRTALAVTRESRGASDTSYAAVLADLGHLLMEQGRHEEAATHLESSVAVLENEGTAGRERLAHTLATLSTVYHRLDRGESAVEAARRSLAHLREALGEDHPRTALALVFLADALDGVGASEQSVELYTAAIPILERTLGAHHSETLLSLNNLAVSLLEMGDPARAADVFRRLVDIGSEREGERSEVVADRLQNLAVALMQLGELEEAETTLERAHGIYSEVLEAGHFRTAFPLLTLAEIRLERGDFEGARAAAEEATRTLSKALPEGHYATTVAECRWGRALAGLGRDGEATPLLEGAASILAGATARRRHDEGCLRGALAHLRSIGASRNRSAPIAERLRELTSEAGS